MNADDRPTRASTATAVAVSVGAAALLVREAGVGVPAAYGAVGAVLMAVLVWVLDREQGVIGSAASSLLVLPVGVGIVAATVGTLLVLAGTLFPVQSLDQLASAAVRMVARAMVVVGGVTTVFGAAVATHGRTNRSTVERGTGVALRTTLVPLGLGVAGLVAETLTLLADTDAASGAGALVGDLVVTASATVFPDPSRPHLASFLALAGAAAYLAGRGLAALPTTELLPAGDRRVPPMERTERRLRRFGVWLLAPVPVVGVLEWALGPRGVGGVLPPVATGLLTWVTTAPAVRRPLWWTVVSALVVLGSVALLRRAVRTSTGRIGTVLAPLAVGAVAAVAASAVAEPVVSGAVEWIAGTLPGSLGPAFRRFGEHLVDAVGPTALVLVAVGVVGLATAVVLSLVWLVIHSGYVEERTAGITVASGNLFATAAFAGVLAVDPLLVLGALVAAVVVWDVGEFGITLGEEVGRRADTRRTELVHAVGTLAVGGVGAGITLVVADAATGGLDVAEGPAVLGLVAVIVGLLSLIVALR